MTISENRKTELAELRRRAFLKNTQRGSHVLRRRIRELREARGLSQRAVAEAMTAAGVPLTGDKVSKLEAGTREVRYDELLAFADVLEVPLARLMSPEDGEPPIRAGGLSLARNEVANWIVWGSPWSADAIGAQTFMRLTLQIQTSYQVLDDERDPERRKEHRQEVASQVKELWQASGIRPGVMERKALREAMSSRPPERSEGRRDGD